MEQQIGSLARQTRRYWYEDGFADLGMGAYLFALGLIFIAEAVTPSGSPLDLVWTFGWPVVLIGGGLLVNFLVQRLKARYTYPRTGYVSYEKEGNARIPRLIGVFVTAALVAAAVILLSRGWHNFALLFGLVFTAGFLYVGFRIGLVRYLALAAFSLASGAVLGTADFSIEQAGGLYFAVVGLAMLLSGGMTWLRYERRTGAG